jgi:hypothetical protein
LSISGKQTGHTLASVAVTALDGNGSALIWFDTDQNSILDSSTGYLVPQVLPNDATFSFDILVPNSAALAKWTQTKIALFDRTDSVSNELSVAVEQQPVRTTGQACDPAAKVDRCAENLECDTSSNTCVSHLGPSLTKVAYVSTSNGFGIIAEGVDSADDVIEMDIGFFDAAGTPVLVNLNNDTTQPLMVASFAETWGITADDGVFAFQINPAETFTETVKQVSLTPVDIGNHKGAPMTASLLPIPSVGSGASCDIWGLNYCSGKAACMPGTPGAANTCQPLGAAQATACANAPVLDPSSKNHVVTGYISGPSLWEPPTTCVSDNGLHHPESVIMLNVPAKFPSLTLSTDRRETQVDTVLYVTSVCSPSATQFLGCNDDAAPGNPTSTLTLSNVTAGTYYVIVDSMLDGGGPFGLTISTP